MKDGSVSEAGYSVVFYVYALGNIIISSKPEKNVYIMILFQSINNIIDFGFFHLKEWRKTVEYISYSIYMLNVCFLGCDTNVCVCVCIYIYNQLCRL